MKIKTGLTEKSRKTISEGLSKILADTYTLELKTHNFHWNVTGPNFPQYHKMFDDQYSALNDAIDGLAERIRSLGFYAPGSYSQFAKLTSIKEAKEIPTAEEMIKMLLDDHEEMARNISDLISLAALNNDHDTADLLTQRLHEHEKTAWMLRSTL